MNNRSHLKIKVNILKIKKYLKVKDHCHYIGKYRGAVHSIYNLKCSIPKEIPIDVFHNGSNYDYHFIIKELREAYEGQFNCLGGNNYITFSGSIEKMLQGLIKKITKTISYWL